MLWTWCNSPLQVPYLEDEEPSAKMWRTPSGDIVALYYFPFPPDIHADPRDEKALYRVYEEAAAGAGLGVVEVSSVQLIDVFAVRTIFRQPKLPHGISFIGGITLPYQDLSYVIKAQCYETGVTGIRDTVVGIALRQAVGTGENILNIRMMIEREEYDSQFPEHPLSRLRAIMKEAQTTVRLDSTLRNQKQFRWNPRAST
jgi:hypothetical protein